jgi:hypothetical protein
VEDNPKIPIMKRFSDNSFIIYLKKSNKTGELPYLIFLIVGLYNIIVFEIPSGYGIYTVLPLAMGIAMYYIKIWKRKDNYRLSGKILLIFFLSYDFILSILFIPGVGSETIKYQSIPTALMDITALYLLLTQKSTEEQPSE